MVWNADVPPAASLICVKRKRLRPIFILAGATAKRMGVEVEEKLEEHVSDRIGRFAMVFASPFISADQTAEMRASLAKLVESKLPVTLEDIGLELAVMRRRAACSDIKSGSDIEGQLRLPFGDLQR